VADLLPFGIPAAGDGYFIANATLSDIEERLSEMMDAEKSVLSVIKNS